MEEIPQVYSAPVTTICSSNTSPNTITINITPYIAFTATNYNLRTYTNNALTSTSSAVYSPNQIVVNDLSYLHVYTFQVQLFNLTQSSEFSIKNENIPVYPVGPTITSRSNITSTSVQVFYDTYSITGATCIINIPGISYNSLTDTSVILTGLTPNTPYSTLTILFRKTINDIVIDSSPSTVTPFTTNGIAPVVLSSNASSATNATLIITNYSSATPGQFTFDSATVVASGATPTIVEITQPNTIYIGNLAAATIYNDCTLTLTASGVISDPSTPFFTIKTLASNPIITANTSTDTTITLTFTKPVAPFGTTQSANAFYSSNVEFTNVTVISDSSGGVVTITGLSSNQTFTNVYITVFDGTYTSVPSPTVNTITTLLSPAPVIGIRTPGYFLVSQENKYDSYINYTETIAYTSGGDSTEYTPFIPTSGILTNISPGSVSTTTSTQMEITNLTVATYYSDCKIALTDASGNRSNLSTAFDFTTSLEVPILFDYAVGNANINISAKLITTFAPSSCLLYYNNNTPATYFEGTAFNGPAACEMQITGLTVGATYTNCFITISGGGNTTADSIGYSTGPTFSFTANDGAFGPL